MWEYGVPKEDVLRERNSWEDMTFIGIITKSKKETEIKQALNNLFENMEIKHTIVLINNKSIENIKNVKFDTIIIDINDLNYGKDITNIISNSNRVIINLDYDENLVLIENLELNAITYGMNSKSTLTISSSNPEYALVTLQRCIKDINGKILEPQEVKVDINKNNKNLYLSMILAIFLLIYGKI